MADDIRLITWSGQNVKPVNDANVYEAALGVGGVKYGCIVTASGANTLSISAGNGVLCGRAFEIFDCTKQVQLSGSGTLQGRVFIHLDLSNTEEPISIQTQTGNSITPPIQQENINVTNGIYEINLATFNVSPSAISNVVNVAPVLDLQAQIQAIADEATAKINALATVARTGSYNDLTNKPTIDTALSTTSTNAVQNKVITTELNKKGTVTGVKGNSQSSYGTGNVNLTAANVGAIPAVSGSTNQLLGFTSSNTVGAISLDTTPTANSNKPVTSGGVKSAIDGIGVGTWTSAGTFRSLTDTATIPTTAKEIYIVGLSDLCDAHTILRNTSPTEAQLIMAIINPSNLTYATFWVVNFDKNGTTLSIENKYIVQVSSTTTEKVSVSKATGFVSGERYEIYYR